MSLVSHSTTARRNGSGQQGTCRARARVMEGISGADVLNKPCHVVRIMQRDDVLLSRASTDMRLIAISGTDHVR
jgi:hypothetical protein